MDRSQRRHFYNLCDPTSALSPDDPRYADLDSARVRGPSLVEKLERIIDFTKQATFELVTAARGAGLTTEFGRLAARLRENVGALPVHLQAGDVVDLHSGIDSSDVLLAMLEGAGRALTH